MPSGAVVAHGIRRSAARLALRSSSSSPRLGGLDRVLLAGWSRTSSRSSSTRLNKPAWNSARGLRTALPSPSSISPARVNRASSRPPPSQLTPPLPPSPSSSARLVFRRTMATSTPANGTMTDPDAPGAIDPAENNSSGVTGPSLEQKLTAALDASHVDVQDISGGCGQSFAATIVSAKFEGKMALARHRLVNAAVKDEVGKIHAWTPKCLTPAEWEKKQQQAQ